jgi:hypothetical protein
LGGLALADRDRITRLLRAEARVFREMVERTQPDD